MTRLDLLGLLVGQARTNGFAFRRWYCRELGLPWVDGKHALQVLCGQKRYYGLLFSHEFAQSFWKSGETMTFLVPTQTFLRSRPDGSVLTVTRKGYTRRSSRQDSWKYHLAQLASQEEPLHYMRRYLKINDDVEDLCE